MILPVTIRNFTQDVFELQTIEYYEGASRPSKQEDGVLSNITKNVSYPASFFLSTTGPSAQQLVQYALNFSTQNVSIQISAFSSATTDVNIAKRHPYGILRLTFDTNGERHRVDIIPSNPASQPFLPLTPNPRSRFLGVFTPEESHLSIYPSPNLSSWMQHLPDAVPLSGLSIPGTHNSPTYHHALPSVRCQAVPLLAQLENGIRFLDIRVQPELPHDPSYDNLLLVHGIFPIALTGPKTLRSLLADLHAFLATHPSETVLVSLKREGPGPATDHDLARILHDHYCLPDPNRWYTAPEIPPLGTVRGKIVLLRRFALAPALQQRYARAGGWGLDAAWWPYNTTHYLSSDPSSSSISASSPASIVAICVQDVCEVHAPSQLPAKVAQVCAHLARAAAEVAPVPGWTTDVVHPVPPGPLYLNFASASHFWRRGCWPERVAKKVNPEVVRYLCVRHGRDEEAEAEDRLRGGGGGGRIAGDGATGVVVLDWVGEGGDWDVVKCIVGMNARLETMRSEMR
ncbi:MAG: hypothetical protein M1821_005486 [Bathelium mastoideum]|nr:MAG: hypothetical protein M1821_005486 [Bathelium mastoideum]